MRTMRTFVESQLTYALSARMHADELYHERTKDARTQAPLLYSQLVQVSIVLSLSSVFMF